MTGEPRKLEDVRASLEDAARRVVTADEELRDAVDTETQASRDVSRARNTLNEAQRDFDRLTAELRGMAQGGDWKDQPAPGTIVPIAP